MARDYSALSGAEMVSKIKKQNTGIFILCILGYLVAAGFLIGVLYMVKEEQSYFMGIVGLLLIAFACYAMFGVMKNAWKTRSDPENARVFRKYGSPDQLAAKISEGMGATLFDSSKAMLTDSFVMKHGDFESYVPYDQILLLYKKEHRTNGILDSIFLVVHDAYGDKFEYPFKLGKKHANEMEMAAEEIGKHAPQCAFGYTKENLAYAAQNAKKLSDE